MLAGGMIIGDMPPYEAFPIGGTNSVRGYSEGGAGTGRKFVSGTGELHIPLVSPVEVSQYSFLHPSIPKSLLEARSGLCKGVLAKAWAPR